MSNSRFLKHCFATWVAVTWICLAAPNPALAQFDFLKSLFGPRNDAHATFRGQSQLSAARDAAVNGDTAKSIILVREAMQTVIEPLPPGEPLTQAVANQLLDIEKLWKQQSATPAQVAEALLDVVLPSKTKDARLYALPWQSRYQPWNLNQPTRRESSPRSVATEMVEWCVRAGRVEMLQQRAAALPKDSVQALTVQIMTAVAIRDVATARERFGELSRLTPALTDAFAAQASLQAVAAGVTLPETEAPALALLETTLARWDELGEPVAFGREGTTAALRIAAASRHMRAGRIDDGTRLAIFAARQPLQAQGYDAEFATQLRRLQSAEAASVLLAGGRVAEALELIAPSAEGPLPRSAAYYPGPNLAAMLGRELNRLPALQRYEILHTWSWPNADRPLGRDLTDFVPGDRAPSATDTLIAAGLFHDVYSTTWDLARTAAELDRLDQLSQDVAALDSNTLFAQALIVFIDLQRPNAAARLRLQAFTDAIKAGVPKSADQNKAPFPMLALGVALVAAEQSQYDRITQALLEQLIDHSQKVQWDRPRAHARLTWAEVLRRSQATDRHVPPSISLWNGFQPRHWTAAGSETAQQHAGGSLPDVWLTHDSYVQHLTGPYDSQLYFQIPLAGHFELTLECREGGWAEGTTGYGGALFAVNGYSDVAPLRAPGNAGYNAGPSLTNLLHRSPWNAQRIQVSGEVVRYFANGQLIHEDRPGSSSPWLSFGSDWGRTPIFRNVKLTGTPQIPREVPLLADGRLRGWIAQYYGESRRDALRELPPSPTGDNPLLSDADDVQLVQLANGQQLTIAAPTTDWQFRGGELQSPRRTSLWHGDDSSWLTYHRPLEPGETLRYEFFYQPTECDVQATIGRRVFRFERQGVTVEWISDGQCDPRGAERAIDRQESRTLPLKDDAWNVVDIEMQADGVALRLNGEPAIMQPLLPQDGRTFGLFHDASLTNVRVRQAILRGPWPEAFGPELRAAIERPEPRDPPTDRLFGAAILSEAFFTDNAYQIYRESLTLEPQARYEYLHRWVMPGSTHATLRMAGAMTPTHPAPPVLNDNPIDAAAAAAKEAVDGRLVQTGGSFVCPAVLLVLTAAELDRLDQLAEAIQRIDVSQSPQQQRPRTALLGMIALLQDRPDEALAAVWESARLILELPPGEQSVRWSEPALASLAILHPATREAAYELIDRIQRRQLQGGQPGSSEFSRYVRQLHGQLHYLLYGGDPALFGAQPRLTQWRAASQTCARARGPGYPLAGFDALGGELALRGGHDFDMAYFQSPLRGNYELRVRLSQYDYRELMTYAAGISNALKYTHDAVKLQGVHTPIQELPTPKKVTPQVRAWGDYRIVVQDGRYRCYVENNLVYEADVSPHADPWLALVGWAGGSQRNARNVVITGTPEIPVELDLLAAGDLQGWLGDYYGTGQSPYPWELRDGELRSHQTVIRNAVPGRLQIENVIRYHRPMFEDGEISYEFYYDPQSPISETAPQRGLIGSFAAPPQRTLPGQTIVHPALDRLVCLLEPDGVKVHWLTDGRYDRTGILPGNVTHEPDRGPAVVPLQSAAWNRVRLATKSDLLSIWLNDQLVFTRPIEPTNLRQFGLFHYVNESTARVRNVRYRGDWPKTLPSVAEQELAPGPEQFAEFSKDELPARYAFDFRNSQFEPVAFNIFWGAAAAEYVRPTDAGLRVTLPAGQVKKTTVAGVKPKLRLSGDFVATMEYEGLKVVPVKESWGCGVSFKVALEQSYEVGFEIRQYATNNGARVVWQIPAPPKQNLFFSESITDFPESARLRIARRGSVLYFLMAPLGSDDFRLVTMRPFGTHDVKTVNLQADCSDQTGGSDVILRQITIQAASITITQ